MTGRWLYALLAVCVVLSSAQALNNMVDLPDGPILGKSFDQNRTVSFLGIPYAQPPVGPLRYAYPVPAEKWGPRVFNATVPGAACPQRCVLPPHTCPNKTSEDCLNLNVFAPTAAGALRPVMVFVHGGRFEQGGAGDALYDGRHLAQYGDVVVVTFNYRLGALGFLKTGNLTGNYGFRDQRLVLEWVQRNIHLFNGDKSRVLLYGQSAGAASTASHLVSPMSKGLFSRAIVESDPLTLPMFPAKQAAYLGERFAADSKCKADDVACLRASDVATVLAAEYKSQKHLDVLAPVSAFMPWTPVWEEGSQDLPQNPMHQFLQGDFNEVPVAFGTMQNDCTMFIYMIWKEAIPWIEYDAVALAIFEEHTLSVHEMYKNASNVAGGDYRPRLGQLGTDYVFACPNRRTMMATSQKTPTYGFVFNHHISVDVWGPMYPECMRFVCHGSELPFVFDTGDLDGYFHISAAEQTLSEEMMGYWTNMAHTGDPNKGPNAVATQWPQFNAESKQLLELKTGGCEVLSGYREAECNYYDSIGYGWGVFNKP